MAGVIFYILVAAAGLGGYAVLIRIGFEDLEAWAGGRVAGLALVALPAWWLGVVGVGGWRWAGAVVLLAGALFGGVTVWKRLERWRDLVRAEAIFTAGLLLVLLIRLDHPQIAGQEKPMDVGIFATLLRAADFPPPDMWLAGWDLPYYYWGALIWTVPIGVSGLPLDYAYNLVVALIGALVFVVLWVLGRQLAGGSHAAGLMAAFFGLFAGTPDALRQLFAGVGLRGIDIWRSSRQHEDVITEFPLFTAWLGDLHPHLLSMPIAALAFLVAWKAGREGPRLGTGAMLAVLFGIAWAANPWAMPPTAAGIALLLLSSDGSWHWPNAEGRSRWLTGVGVVLAGWLVTAPFHLGFEPFFQGIKPVFAWTAPVTLLLYGGHLLLPAFAAVLVLVARRFGSDPVTGRAVVLGATAVVVIVAALTQRPTLVMLAAGWLAVVDTYGDRLHRMNTVFKAYIQAWMFLALALPVLVRLSASRPVARRVLTVVITAAALPHLLWMLLNQTSAPSPGLDGLAWMPQGDRATVRHLRELPRDTAIIEAVGGAYSEYARLSANSGVPAYLGWENHELVWRGHGVTEETGSRSALVGELYRCGDPVRVRELVAAAGVDLVAIGSLERKDFPESGLEAVRAAGEVELDQEGGVLVRFPRKARK
jgi:uncharacterized membrane protein